MSKWEDHDMLNKVRSALQTDGGRYMTPYQLAIKLERAHPGLSESLGKQLGGAGIGSPNSLTEYLAGQLARVVADGGSSFPIEAAHLSPHGLRDIRFVHPGGGDMVSSLTESGTPMSLFRWRG